jgi:glutamate/tyrosine decarboxylase-like PLP-dependent enzyme
LDALADVCQREGLWLHVDGAFGAWAKIANGTEPLVKGIERADSLAFDLHKWMYMPFDVACILIRREEDHFKTFAEHPDYFGNAETMKMRTDYGLQVSRYFRALVWMGLQEHGLAKFGGSCMGCDQAQYLLGFGEGYVELGSSLVRRTLSASGSGRQVCRRLR